MKTLLMLMMMLVVLGSTKSQADTETFLQERQYEPVVLRSSVLRPLFDIPVDQIYMYAYDEATNAMKIIPFQIDERVLTEDPFREGSRRHFYANPDDPIADDNGLVDDVDELVFLVRDLGPKAPSHIWVDDQEALQNKRIEIKVSDPNDPEKVAYGYLFYSSTLSPTVPAPYNFAYNQEQDRITSTNYSIGLNPTGGLIKDISINSPLGSGADILDTQKLRLVGIIDLGLINLTFGKDGFQAANERDFFYIYPLGTNYMDGEYLTVTKKPIVRLVREVRQTLRIGTIPLDDMAFYVGTKFYPYNGVLEGGGSLNPDKLKEMFPEADDIYMQFDLVRQSWDFNESAVGMKFYNPVNDGVAIDGNPDDVNRTIPAENLIRTWTMASGDQGSLFTHLTIFDSTYKKIELYYHDNQEGGQDDDSYIEGGDTGDGKSYGDQGLKIMDSQNLELGFTAYFIDKNQGKTMGEQLAYNVENPVIYTSSAIDFPTKVAYDREQHPAVFELNQNYPNPFNNSTVFTFQLPETSHTVLRVYDLNGRLIKTLVDKELKGGIHTVSWNGMDELNQTAASGIYIYELQTDQHRASMKLLLVK